MLRYEVFDPMPMAGRRLEFDIEYVIADDRRLAVREVVAAATPFCILRRFEVDPARPAPRSSPLPGSSPLPRLLIVAPLSGHYSAMLRDLVVALLPDHDVHITDWRDVRDVALADGDFDLGDNIAHVIDFLRRMGEETHVVALCQGAVPALAATALLAEDGDPAEPRSLSLIAGNIDPGANPSRVSSLLAARPLDWFVDNVIARVPDPYRGAGRKVYPGFVQRVGLTLYLARHLSTQGELFDKLFFDDGLDALRHPFVRRFLTVMDLNATFFLSNIDEVFHRRVLARGCMTVDGRPVAPAAISRCGLMTVEGERDDVASPGQTRAAHDLCPSIPDARRRHYLQTDVGHFGTFHGRCWRVRIMPRIAAFIREMESRRR